MIHMASACCGFRPAPVADEIAFREVLPLRSMPRDLLFSFANVTKVKAMVQVRSQLLMMILKVAFLK